MTVMPLLLLTVGAVNWGYIYPVVFLFFALLVPRLSGRPCYFNFLYSPCFWLLFGAGISYVAIGMRKIPALYHYGILPAVAYAIGWLAAEEHTDEQIRDGMLALTAGFGIYASLNMVVNIGNNRYRLIDFWTRSYRAATGSGSLNTLLVSSAVYTVKFEKRLTVKIFFLILLTLSFQYMFMLGTRTQFAVFLVVTLLAVLYLAYVKQGIAGMLKCLAVIILSAGVLLLMYWLNIFSVKDYISGTNLAARYTRRASLANADAFRFQGFWTGLRELVQYPLGCRAAQPYRHNMWLDVGRVSGIIPFALLLIYSVKNFRSVLEIWRNTDVIPGLRYLLLFLYMGAYANCFVEPIWEGTLNFFLAVCVMDGMVGAKIRSLRSERFAEKDTPFA